MLSANAIISLAMRKFVDVLDPSLRPERVIWYLAWPTVLEQLLITMVNYVDTAMVGSLGANATAAISLTSATTWLINGVFAAIGVGFSVPVGRYMGMRDYESAKKVVRQAALAIVLFGLAFTGIIELVAPRLPAWLNADEAIRADAVRYLSIIGAAYMFTMSTSLCSAMLRCAGDTRTPLFFNTAANILNMILNFFLIYSPREVSVLGLRLNIWGAGLGVSGAAIATAISLIFSGTMLFITLYFKDSPIRAPLTRGLRFDKAIWKDMIKLATPVAFERVTLSSGQIVMTAMVTSLGTASLAANYLAIQAESLTYMPAFGIAAAATTLTAQALGANRPDMARTFAKKCSIIGLVFMTSMGFVLYFGASALIGIFTPDVKVIALGAAVLQIEALAQPCYALAQVCSGVLRGARDTRWPFYGCLIGMWAVRIPLAYVLTHVFTIGLAGVWIGMASDLTVRGIVMAVRLKVSSRKWGKAEG